MTEGLSTTVTLSAGAGGGFGGGTDRAFCSAFHSMGSYWYSSSANSVSDRDETFVSSSRLRIRSQRGDIAESGSRGEGVDA